MITSMSQSHYRNSHGRDVKIVQRHISNGQRTVQVDIIQQSDKPYVTVRETHSNGQTTFVKTYKVSLQQMENVVNENMPITKASTTPKTRSSSQQRKKKPSSSSPPKKKNKILKKKSHKVRSRSRLHRR